ncbi:MAG: hypothetical protein PHC54_01775 [Candidatus Omnitrophica bacterium]|nr:hypothetical protein [Candidatus Omnitrophota bacterium]MDD5591691.1 hypothetical protein [Candidatus Omnitrophota bacterium]
MKKKDIYEHLAHIYLDASSKKRRSIHTHPQFFPRIFLASFIIIGVGFLFAYINRNRNLKSDTALVLCFDPVKVNFHFDPAKKEIYSINLNKLNLAKFKTLAFAVKRTDYRDNLSLRIELTNIFREKSELYIKNIPHRWQDYKINLSEFKNISAWSEMVNLSFIVEEWNAKGKKGIVYLDNIRFLR